MFTLKKRITTATILLILFCVSTNDAWSQYTRETDSLTLVDLYNSCNGTNWNNNSGWLEEDVPINDWYGVGTSGGRVTGLYLNSQSLSGTLPDSIGLLSELTSINLRNNNLTGDLPASLNDLNKLTSLYIDNNQYDFGNLIASGLMPNSISTYDYTPQQEIDAPEKTVAYPNIVLSVPYLEGNNYNWYAEGTLIQGADCCVYSFTPLSSLNYYVRVTNDLFPALSLQTKPIAIDAIETLEIAGLTTTDVLCNGGHDGKVSFNITGGAIDDYTYSLDKTNWVAANESEIVIDTLSAKEYTIWVNDGYSSDSVNFIIEAPDALVIDTINLRPLSYLGASDGEITITTINGGTDGDKQLNLDGTNTYTFTDDSLTLDELSAGNHFLLATDAAGCSSDTLWFTITQPDTFTFTAHIAKHETNAGAADGVIVIDSIYASQTLRFEYTKDNRATWVSIEQGDSITGLTAGDYTIILRVGVVESEPETFTIEQTCSSYVVTVNDSTKCGDTKGTITINGLNPDKEYQYLLIPKGQGGKPTITLLGDNPLTWTLGETFVDPGATAYDDKDGDITDDIVTYDNIDINTEGTYQVTYNVTDSDGNAAEEVVRTVVVEEIKTIWGTEIVEVTNPITGRTWMDRNIGATRAATSSTDEEAYGYLFQWGRNPDGHELRTSGTTTTLSSTDVPGHDDFIISTSFPCDWRSPQNNNLWQGIIQDGWRLPTEAELEEERLSWSSNNAAGAFASPLKLPLAGYRNYSNGTLYTVGSLGLYWSSTVSGFTVIGLGFYNSDVYMSNEFRARSFSVRLIKDYSHTPTITLLGDSSVTINIGDTYTDAGATAHDTRYGDITSDIITVNNVNTSVAGTYTVTYNITTEDGYSAEEVVRSVIVEAALTEIWGTEIVEVTNPITGRTWMDRNIGATRAATSSTDSEAYGHLFQWGRNPDGHELRTSGTTSTLSSTDVPGHGDFITNSIFPRDWRSPQNNNLWQGIIADGWRLPTEQEWLDEIATWSSNNSSGAYNSVLKLLLVGSRLFGNGTLYNVGSYGYYWSSTVDGTDASYLYFLSSYAGMNSNYRAFGFSVRLIKD